MRTLVALGGMAVIGTSAASASPCGGGGDDSSSSFSSTDFSSDASDTPPCEGPCAEYAAWQSKNLPVVTLDVGFAARTLASPLGTQTGSVTHDMQSFSYRVVGPASQASAPLENALVGQLRLTAPLRHHLYFAGELEVGALTDSAVAAEMTSSGELGTPTLTSSATMLVGGVGIAGIGGRIGSVDLGVEIAGGIRALAYSYDSTYLACETTSTITATSPVLEGRARASMWLSAHVTLTATAGKSALDDGMVGGLSIGFTNHAFARR